MFSTERWRVKEENCEWNEDYDATQPWCQQNHDKYGENMANKVGKDDKQTQK